ncbi:MAG: PD-(D/E)XK nuclease family protein [Rhodoferax sp.]|uniref:PD-(D/E)XK nuclease family protein n=1 Tax=Rhodoferax sp. TaxID=50421 RepID=UPI002719BC90|nr:PD-(D/E)XK nuclease family protein [Rhodoferax sp.]MDO8447575.1 PD-(D/E)XK nuclease family protein [Rhodoferax sp.]
MDEIAKKHPAQATWDKVMGQIRTEMARQEVHPSRTVVLVPYAQLMQEARSAWLRGQDGAQAHFVPRFETTMNWTRSLGGFEPGGDDMQLDAARDVLTAASLLSRAGLGAYESVLSARVMEAAWSLARTAAAVAPMDRAPWGARLAAELSTGMESTVLALEAATAQIALAWAASSSYPSDPVFSAAPDLLVLLEGFQAEPMALALQQRLGERALVLSLVPPLAAQDVDSGAARVALHTAQDAEDEAHRAAACVLAHLAAGHGPVALVAQDRVLTRRVSAMLGGCGVAVRDETGWKLSTTRAAASLMNLLRACAWDASTDAVLDWLKNSAAFEPLAVTQAEASWRRMGVREWRSVPVNDGVALQVKPLRDSLQAGRPLARWLADLRSALQSAGQWPGLLQDPAGQAVLDALRLREGAEFEFLDVPTRMGLNEFTAWVSQTMEGASFSPEHPAHAQVVILPLSQVLGRPLAAVVFPGCDEIRLPLSPEPPGMWTPAQRALLGLPSREQLADAARAAWRYALQFPNVDVLWRQSEGGEHLMASGFVQELRLQQATELSPDPRVVRTLAPQPCAMPSPTGDELPLTRLSSTAYEDLRRCPYRFFALRQLKLQEPDELDLELGKRDFGNWLHHVLKLFHESLNQAPAPELSARVAMINVAAEQATQELGLSQSEFLPFAAAWPRVRAGYLQWLADHEASGAAFLEAEAWKETPLGRLNLVGKIDRIDRLADGSALVIDYKTEARSTTAQRIKESLEDTQLAFYAALLTDDTLAAAYVNVGEKDATRSYAQPDIVVLRDQLLEGIANDMARIAAGALMPALGEGKACEFCAARGLCRKDFWELA